MAMPQTDRALTAADLAALPTHLPSGSVRYELEKGNLRIMSPTGDIHGGVESRIGGLLLSQGEERAHGQARVGEVGIVLGRGPDTVKGADACFLTKIVEVVSKN